MEKINIIIAKQGEPMQADESAYITFSSIVKRWGKVEALTNAELTDELEFSYDQTIIIAIQWNQNTSQVSSYTPTNYTS